MNLGDIDHHIGGRMRLRRMAIGLSQKEVARQMGLTFQQIQKYEKGLNRISGSRIYQLCKILDIMPNYFFEELLGATNKKPSSHVNKGVEMRRDSIALLKDYNDISSLELKAALRKIASTIAASKNEDDQEIPIAAMPTISDIRCEHGVNAKNYIMQQYTKHFEQNNAKEAALWMGLLNEV